MWRSCKRTQRCLARFVMIAREHTVTLLFGAHDEEHNDAVVLREVLVRDLHAR